jgi:hypothetical protein
MRGVSTSTRRIRLVLLFVILPLSALVCDGGPVPLQGNATATSEALPGSGSVPATPTSTAGDFTLEYSRQGTITTPEVTIKWGPDTAQIPLNLKDGAFVGSYEGEFKAAVSGSCTGEYTYPVSVEVNATEEGSRILDFTVTATLGMSGILSCSTGPVGNEPVTFTRTFGLATEEGASKVFAVPMQSYGELIDTFTLRMR